MDRYIFAQLIGPMGFFALVLVGLFWITQSLRIVEIVVNNNQSGIIFLELSALLLPGVIGMILPFATFAAAVFVINRLYGESELVVMMASGRSQLALSRPFLLFGISAAIATAILTTTLSPLATEQLRQRTADLRAELTNTLMQGGRFINPQPGLTLFVREANRDGSMLDVFIHDQSDPEEQITYTAQQAQLVRSGDSAQVVMVNGTSQTYSKNEQALTVIDFDRVIVDLGVIIRPTDTRRRKATEFLAWENITVSKELQDQNPRLFGSHIAEGHDQFSSPLFALVMPLVALSGLLWGGHRRIGLGSRIAAVVGIALSGRIVGLGIKAQVAGNPDLWPLLYAIPACIGLGALSMLLLSDYSRRRHKAILSQVA